VRNFTDKQEAGRREWEEGKMGIEEEENREKEAGSFKRFFNLKA